MEKIKLIFHLENWLWKLKIPNFCQLIITSVYKITWMKKVQQQNVDALLWTQLKPHNSHQLWKPPCIHLSRRYTACMLPRAALPPICLNSLGVCRLPQNHFQCLFRYVILNMLLNLKYFWCMVCYVAHCTKLSTFCLQSNFFEGSNSNT